MGQTLVFVAADIFVTPKFPGKRTAEALHLPKHDRINTVTIEARHRRLLQQLFEIVPFLQRHFAVHAKHAQTQHDYVCHNAVIHKRKHLDKVLRVLLDQLAPVLVLFERFLDRGKVEVRAERVHKRGVNKQIFFFVQFAVGNGCAKNETDKTASGVNSGYVQRRKLPENPQRAIGKTCGTFYRGQVFKFFAKFFKFQHITLLSMSQSPPVRNVPRAKQTFGIVRFSIAVTDDFCERDDCRFCVNG